MHFGLGSWWPFQVARELLSASLEAMPAAWLIFFHLHFNLLQFSTWPGGGGNFCIPPPSGRECRLLLGALPPCCCNGGDRWHVRTKGLSLLKPPAGFSFSIGPSFCADSGTHSKVYIVPMCKYLPIFPNKMIFVGSRK